MAEFQALLSTLGLRTAVRIRPDDLRRVAVRTMMIWVTVTQWYRWLMQGPRRS